MARAQVLGADTWQAPAVTAAEYSRKRRYLFALVGGCGTVPPELGAARRLVERGHCVEVANIYGIPASEMPPFGLGLQSAGGPMGRARDRIVKHADETPVAAMVRGTAARREDCN
jgi:hypothetical protein